MHLVSVSNTNDVSIQHQIVPTIKQINSILVDKVVIPKSFYNIMAGITVNTIIFRKIDLTLQPVTIPDGYYDFTTFMTELMTSMNFFDGLANYTYTNDPASRKTTIFSLNPNFQLHCQLPNVLTRYIGFDSILYTGFSLYNGIYPFNMQYTNFVYVISSLLTGNNSYSRFPSDSNLNPKHSVLCTVPISDEEFDSNVVYRGQYPIPFPTRMDEMSNITFSLVDDNGQKINLNNNSWMIDLVIFQ